MSDNLQNKLLSLLLAHDDNEDIAKLKRALGNAIQQTLTPQPLVNPADQPKLLQKAFENLNKRHDFKPGQLVKWKSGLRNKMLPSQDQPGIVLELLPAPIFARIEDEHNALFREPHDIRIGILGNMGELISYVFDSRRFEPL